MFAALKLAFVNWLGRRIFITVHSTGVDGDMPYIQLELRWWKEYYVLKFVRYDKKDKTWIPC